MGKHALVVLCAAFAVLVSRAPAAGQSGGQAVDPYACQFLTAEELEHIDAALGYVNLNRAQLAYEKKHIDHKYRLKVADAGLDDPLGLPRTAEQAARDFTTPNPAAARSLAAARLLDLPTTRWTAEELQKDTEEWQKLMARYNDQTLWPKRDTPEEERRRMEVERARVDKELDEHVSTLVFGVGTVQELFRTSGAGRWLSVSLNRRSHSTWLSTAGSAWKRAVPVEPTVLSHLAATLPGEFLEAPQGLPGGVSVANNPPELFSSAASIDLASRLVAGTRLSMALESESKAFGPSPEKFPENSGEATHLVRGVTGGIVAAWQGPWGKFVIGGTGPNTYEGDDFIGIIDLGGDDTYRGRVACGIGLPGRAPISFVLDLGGNDQYLGEDFTQGFGFNGVGILHDLGSGNDLYRARFCAQGCGLCGYGELYDDGGDDIYTADSGAQGAAAFGYGHLIDAKGNDIYRGARYVQAFAQVMGVGVLTDGAGNDLYFAGAKYLHQPLWNDRYQSLSQGFAIGNRYGGTGGGVALLLDEGDGNDVYQSDIYGQGSSYWFSLGMLVDRGGNDTYTSGQYCQGVGIHLSAGILVDLAGNDTYTMGVGLGQGAAHDWAVGWLIDRAGNDLYQGNGQGMGLNFSVGILLDCAGDDSHSTSGDGSIGKGSNNDISLLIDLGGYDVYGHKETKDSAITRRDKHALVYDVAEGWFPAIDVSTLPTRQDPPPAKVRVQHILIAWDGTGVGTQKAKRTKEEATAAMKRVLKQARTKGADWAQLQQQHNEDCAKGLDAQGQAYDNTHNIYDVTATAKLVKPFLDCSMKLGVGQIDVAESKYGWHIIKRVE